MRKPPTARLMRRWRRWRNRVARFKSELSAHEMRELLGTAADWQPGLERLVCRPRRSTRGAFGFELDKPDAEVPW